jgi:hypothetical protein
MSFDGHEDYFKEVESAQTNFKVETLRIQRKLLYSISKHHRLWAENADSPEIAAFHIRAADSVQEVIDQYDQLLGRY